MCRFKIRLKSITDVQEFTNIATKLDVPLDLTSGRYVVDGKSLMGILSLSLTGDILCTVYADSEEIPDFLDDIKNFITGPLM